MRKSEANFLRFLRTSERAENYHTLKIIGKGAFGEVKLVQRKHDGKVYALKSLVKSEMVCSISPFIDRPGDTDLLSAQEGSARACPR
jgi:serine/threonine protein kinase